MTIHNGDVYVGGYYLNTDRFCPAYWKNGEMTAITEYANACIGEMFVLDGETIIIYFEQNEAGNTTVKCSMNGEIIDISDGSAPSYAQCGFII